jgi:pimeloyl-ACP methyl ester carboxylesterase
MQVSIDGRKIEYEILGDGRPIVFLHGWGGSIDSLYPIAKGSSQKYKAVVLSLPGFGESDLPRKDWGVYKYSEFIERFLLEINLKKQKPILFGHSFGGGIAAVLAYKYRDEYSGVILCAPALKRFDKSQNIKKGVTGKLLNTNLYQELKKYLYPFRKLAYKLIYGNTGYLQHPSLEKNFQKIITQDLISQVTNIDIPMLFLWGEADTQTPISQLREILNKLQVPFEYEKNKSKVNENLMKSPGSDHDKVNSHKSKQTNQIVDYVIYPEVTHGLPLQEPRKVYKDLNEFINKYIW